MGNGVANGEVIDFGALSGVHFARIVVVPADTDHRGRPLPANVVYLADLDVSPEEHLAELAGSVGEGVDRVFGHCEGYPAGTPGEPERLGWLRSRVARAPATYVNTRGRTNEQIRAGGRAARGARGVPRPPSADLHDRDPARSAMRSASSSAGSRELAWALEPAERPGSPPASERGAPCRGRAPRPDRASCRCSSPRRSTPSCSAGTRSGILLRTTGRTRRRCSSSRRSRTTCR